MMAVAIFAFYGTKADHKASIAICDHNPYKAIEWHALESATGCVYEPTRLYTSLTRRSPGSRVLLCSAHTFLLGNIRVTLHNSVFSCSRREEPSGSGPGRRQPLPSSCQARTPFILEGGPLDGTLRPEEIRSFMKELVMTAVVSVDSLVHVSAPLFPCSMVNVV
ncbi:hypothetical protein EV401DRAFT_1976549, partial [Pisolithus croceorrhizus]